MEDQIAATLAANVPQGYTPPTPQTPGFSIEEQSASIQSGISEYSLMKFASNLGVDISYMDADTTSKLKYIYETISETTGKTDLDSVLENLKDTLIRQGFLFREDRFMKLWLYMRLNKERQAIDNELSALHG